MRHSRPRPAILVAAMIAIQAASFTLNARQAAAGLPAQVSKPGPGLPSWKPPVATQPRPGRRPGLIHLPGPSPEMMAEMHERNRRIREIHREGVEKGQRLTTTLEIESLEFIFDPDEVERWVSCGVQLQRRLFGDLHHWYGSTKGIARTEGAPRALRLTAKLRLENTTDEPMVIWTGLDPENASLDFDVRIQLSPNAAQLVTVDRYYIVDGEPMAERQVVQPGKAVEIPFDVVLAGSWARYGHTEEEFQFKVKYRSGSEFTHEATDYTYVEAPTLTIPGERRLQP